MRSPCRTIEQGSGAFMAAVNLSDVAKRTIEEVWPIVKMLLHERAEKRTKGHEELLFLPWLYHC